MLYLVTNVCFIFVRTATWAKARPKAASQTVNITKLCSLPTGQVTQCSDDTVGNHSFTINVHAVLKAFLLLTDEYQTGSQVLTQSLVKTPQLLS